MFRVQAPLELSYRSANRVMDTLIRLSVITLLSLLVGCAAERAGQGLNTREKNPHDQVQTQSANVEKKAEEPPMPVVAQDKSPVRANEQLTEPATKQPVTRVTVEEAHPTPAEVVVPVTKTPPHEASNPQPAVRWSRELTVSQERFLDRNENSLLRVYVDMSKAEVMTIMSHYRAGDWVNPCKQEKRMDDSGKVYDVVFYLSRRPVNSRPFNERLMTPVILRDNRVYAIGRYSLKKLRAASHVVNSTTIGCQHV